MKKTILTTVLIAFLSLVTVSNVCNSLREPEEKMSELMLDNIEALASGELGEKLDCWSTVSSTNGSVLSTHVTYCGTCNAVLAKSWSNRSICNQKQ